MTLTERYEQAKSQRQPRAVTPALAFVQQVAEVTKKSEIAVRRWLSGASQPDALTQDVLARHFSTTPEELFPSKKSK